MANETAPQVDLEKASDTLALMKAGIEQLGDVDGESDSDVDSAGGTYQEEDIENLQRKQPCYKIAREKFAGVTEYEQDELTRRTERSQLYTADPEKAKPKGMSVTEAAYWNDWLLHDRAQVHNYVTKLNDGETAKMVDPLPLVRQAWATATEQEPAPEQESKTEPVTALSLLKAGAVEDKDGDQVEHEVIDDQTAQPEVKPIKEGEITNSTELVSLFSRKLYRSDQKVREIITALASELRPLRRGYIALDEANHYPTPTLGFGYNAYGPTVLLTFAKLLYAPCIRIFVDFRDGNAPLTIDGRPDNTNDASKPFLQLGVDFHFANDATHPGRGCYDMKIEKEKRKGGLTRLEFDTTYATAVTGFNKIERVKSRLEELDLAFIGWLKRLMNPSEAQHVTIDMCEIPPPDTEKGGNVWIRAPPKPKADEAPSVKYAEDPIWTAVLDLLPGGRGYLLPSLYALEYSFYRHGQGDIQIAPNAMPGRKRLMESKIPHPMVPMKADYTFANIDEAAAQWAYYSHIQYKEEQAAMKLFCRSKHLGKIYKLDRIVVIGLRFNSFTKLANVDNEVLFRFPENSKVTLKYSAPTKSEPDKNFERTVVGFASESPIGNMPAADVYVYATNVGTSRIGQEGITIKQLMAGEQREPIPMTVEVDVNESTMRSQMVTAERMLHESNARWHGLILNQDHRKMKLIDMVTEWIKRLDSAYSKEDRAKLTAEAEAAFEEMLTWKTWNKEQLAALKLIRQARSACAVILGIAGTGKTLLILGLTMMFAKMGLHVMMLAPANSNVDDMANKLYAIEPNFPAARLYPDSKDLRLSEMATGIPERPKLPEDAEVELHIVLDRIEQQMGHNIGARERGFQYQVLAAARNGKYKGKVMLPFTEKDKDITEPRDMFGELASCLEMCEDNTFKWDDMLQRKRLKQSYRNCLKYLVAVTRIVQATTTNSRSPTLRKEWAQGKYDVECRGVIVIADETAKDLEINILIPMLEETWSEKVFGIIMFGDETQLKPTVTAAVHPEFAETRKRALMTLPARLSHEGFKSIVRLYEQNRMNQAIAEFPGAQFYGGMLRSAPSTATPLGEVYKNLPETLTKILEQFGHHTPISEDILRVQYFIVKGTRRTNDNTKSCVVLEHCDFFMHFILPFLQDLFGNELSAKVFILVGYRETLRYWMSRIQAHLRESKSKRDWKHYPAVHTIDSSQGKEALMTIEDSSVQDVVNPRADIGFIAAPERVNVALTRAQHVRWHIGGRCEGPFLTRETGRPTVVTFFKSCVSKGQTTSTAPPGMAWKDIPELPYNMVPPHLRRPC